MKNFDKIAKEVANMRWSIIDPETTTFEQVEQHTIQAIQQALSEIWFKYDFKFTQTKESVLFATGSDSIVAPKGDIIRAWVNGQTSYLTAEENNDFIVKSTGYPTRYWVDISSSGNSLNIDTVADKDYQINLVIKTLMKARDLDGNAKSNLELADDVLNIPEVYEEMFLNALKNLSMVYLIADSQDENYYPYKEQADIHVKALLNLNGTKQVNVVRIY